MTFEYVKEVKQTNKSGTRMSSCAHFFAIPYNRKAMAFRAQGSISGSVQNEIAAIIIECNRKSMTCDIEFTNLSR